MNASELGGYQWGVVVGASLAAALFDLGSRRIPNRLTLPLALAGLTVAGYDRGWNGLCGAGAACLLLALPYGLLFVFGGGGAGDAKMMGALGAWLGLEAGVVVLVAVAITGGVMGLASMIVSCQRKSRLSSLLVSLYVFALAWAGGRPDWNLLKAESEESRPPERWRGAIPYGPAIFIGACIGAWVVHLWRI